MYFYVITGLQIEKSYHQVFIKTDIILTYYPHVSTYSTYKINLFYIVIAIFRCTNNPTYILIMERVKLGPTLK